MTPTARADELARRAGPHLDGLRHVLDTPEAPDARLGTIRLGGPAELMTLRILPTLALLTARGLRPRVALGLAEDLLTALEDTRLDLVGPPALARYLADPAGWPTLRSRSCTGIYWSGLGPGDRFERSCSAHSMQRSAQCRDPVHRRGEVLLWQRPVVQRGGKAVDGVVALGRVSG